MAGLKGILREIIYQFQKFWYGNPEKYFITRGCGEKEIQEILAKQKATDLDLARNNLWKYKKHFEQRIWDDYRRQCLKKEYVNCKVNTTESNTSEINIGILEWFKDKWLIEETPEKIKFYLWMEANYTEHLLAYDKNKREHFMKNRRKNRYTSAFSGGKKTKVIVVELITFFSGIFYCNTTDSILQRVNEWKIVKDLPNWGINLICILLPLLLLIIMIVIFRISFGANFEAKDVKLNDNKGTWLRHVKAISGYQSELIAYIWDIGIYGSYPCQKDRDLLLMARIYNLWKENIDKFQTNMNPNDNINVSDK